MKTTLVGLSGSLRRDSFNTRLLHASQRLCPDGTTLDIQSIESVPLYNFDVENADGIPTAVTDLKEKIASADGLLIATPEYNNSIPGVLKNAIDWLSRPADDISRVFGERPVAIIGATPGGFGTMLAQNAWLPIMRTLGTRMWTGGRLLVPHAGQLFDDAGNLNDGTIEKRLESFLAGFVEFVEATKVEQ